jgi:hypothetical protein
MLGAEKAFVLHRERIPLGLGFPPNSKLRAGGFPSYPGVLCVLRLNLTSTTGKKCSGLVSYRLAQSESESAASSPSGSFDRNIDGRALAPLS